MSLLEFGLISPVLGPRSECSGASSPECDVERGSRAEGSENKAQDRINNNTIIIKSSALPVLDNKMKQLSLEHADIESSADLKCTRAQALASPVLVNAVWTMWHTDYRTDCLCQRLSLDTCCAYCWDVTWFQRWMRSMSQCDEASTDGFASRRLLYCLLPSFNVYPEIGAEEQDIHNYSNNSSNASESLCQMGGIPKWVFVTRFPFSRVFALGDYILEWWSRDSAVQCIICAYISRWSSLLCNTSSVWSRAFY